MGTKHHRLPREHYKGRVWAVFTLCLEGRHVFFTNASVVGVFVDFLRDVAHKFAFRAIYCFMPDHLHVISLGNSDHSDVLQGIEDFKHASGYWLKEHHDSIRWEKSFHDRIIRARQLGIKLRYVLDNPVRAGLVTDWRQYPFTGAIGLDLELFVEELSTE
jgi:REP element-mobilizing transposase RayT